MTSSSLLSFLPIDDDDDDDEGENLFHNVLMRLNVFNRNWNASLTGKESENAG